MAIADLRPLNLKRGLHLEYLTVGWNVVEGIIAVAAGIAAGSIALIGFGVDSFVETISGAVIIWRLMAEIRGQRDDEAIELIEQRAERVVVVLVATAWTLAKR